MESKMFLGKNIDSIQNSQNKSIRKKVCENNYSHLKWNTKFNVQFNIDGLDMIKQGNLQDFIKIYFNLPQFKKESYKQYYMYFEQLKDIPMLIGLERNRSLELFKEFIEQQLEQRDQVKKFTDFIQQIQNENSSLIKDLNKTKKDNIQKQNIFKENIQLQRDLDSLFSKNKKLLKRVQQLQWDLRQQGNQNDKVKLEIFENQCIKNKLDDYKIIQEKLKQEIIDLKENQNQLKMKIDVNEDNKQNWIKESANIQKKIKMEKQKIKLLQGQQKKLNQEIKLQQQVNDYKEQNEQIALKIQNFEKNINDFKFQLQNIDKNLLKKRKSLITLKKKIKSIEEKLNNKEEQIFQNRPHTNKSQVKGFPLRSSSNKRKSETAKSYNFYPNSKQLRSFRRSNVQTNILKSEINQNFIFSMNNLEQEIEFSREQKISKIKKCLEKYIEKNEQYLNDIQNKLKFLKWKIKSSFFLINQKISDIRVQKNVENSGFYQNQNLLKNLDDTFNSKMEAFSFNNKSLLNEKSKDEFNIFINQLGTTLNIEIQNTQTFFSDCLRKIENLIIQQNSITANKKKYNALKKLLLQLIQQNQIQNLNKSELITLLSDSTIKKYDKN